MPCTLFHFQPSVGIERALLRGGNLLPGVSLPSADPAAEEEGEGLIDLAPFLFCAYRVFIVHLWLLAL